MIATTGKQPDYWQKDGRTYARTRQLAASAIGVVSRTVSEWLSRGCPGSADHGYCLPEIVAWCKENVWGAAADGDTTGEMAGPVTPALERFREERFLLARMERQEKSGQLIQRDEVRMALGRLAELHREHGDALQRDGHEEAFDLFEEFLDEYRDWIASSFRDGDEPPPESP